MNKNTKTILIVGAGLAALIAVIVIISKASANNQLPDGSGSDTGDKPVDPKLPVDPKAPDAPTVLNPWEELGTNQQFDAKTGMPMFPVIKFAPWANKEPQYTEAYIMNFRNFQIVSEPIGENRKSPFRARLTNPAYQPSGIGAEMIRTSVSSSYNLKTNDVSSVKLGTAYKTDWQNTVPGYLIVDNPKYKKTI